MKGVISRRIFREILKPKRFAIFSACLIGLVSGLAAVLLEQGVGWVGRWRVQESLLLPAYLLLPAMGLVCGYIAGLIVERFAPETSGSGMSEVKAVLSRVPIPLDLRVAAIKMVGSILVLGSGQPLGREGPTVQIGAGLAAQLSRWIPTSPDYRRQLIAAGAGAGLAAAFDAPIAGVMFVVEELLQDLSGITLGTAILASFIAAVVSRICGSHSLDLDLHLAPAATSFSAEEIPFYLLLGVVAGLLGVLFNKGVLASLTLYRRMLPVGLPLRVGLAGLVSGLLVAMLPLAFRDNA
jgi:CIC family chloride channel protein